MTDQHAQPIQLALRILGYMVEQGCSPSKPLVVRDIISALGITEDEFWTADAFLAAKHYVTATAGGVRGHRWLSADGLSFYDEAMHPLSSDVQIGAIFQGPVTATQIQALASAVQSTVQQISEDSSTEQVEAVFLKAVEDMVAAVRDELSVPQLAWYANTADVLTQEVRSDTPDRSTVRRLASSLSFLGDIDGALGLGERVFRLAATVAPYVPVVLAAIDRILD